MKKAAKFLAQKFATGASVTRNPQGFDEIVIQGDVTEEVVRILWTNLGAPWLLIAFFCQIDLITDQAGPLQGAPADQIVKVEAKAKGAAAAA